MQLIEPAISYYPKRRAIFRLFLTFFKSSLKGFKVPILPRELSLSERIVEYPFIHENLGDLEKRSKILDVGSFASKLPIELASRGFKVWSIDLQKHPYPRTHPNFTPLEGDIRRTEFGDEFFDAIIFVSTLEHIGLTGEKDLELEEEKKAIDEVKRIIAPKGRLLITVPFSGIRRVTKKHGRVYDLPSLYSLLSNFELVKQEFAIKKDDEWIPAHFEEAEKSNLTFHEIGSIAMLIARAKKT